MRVNEWVSSVAPRPSDLDWKNLAFDNTHRLARKCIIALFLITFGFLLVYPFTYLLIYLPMYVGKDGTFHNKTQVSENKYSALLAMFMLPVILFCINFLLLPFMIFRFVFHENNHKYSSREFSIMNKCFIYMVFNSVFLPGLTLTIALRFVQLLAFPRIAASVPFAESQDNMGWLR
jgi:hypothetical protein